MPLTLLPTTLSTAPLSGTLNFDVSTQVVLYMDTVATGDFQINFRGNSGTTFASVVPVGNTLYTMLSVKLGSTAYNLTAITVDGIAPTFLGWMKDSIPTLTVSNATYQIPINISHVSAGVFVVY